jgi:hypothetical protein
MSYTVDFVLLCAVVSVCVCVILQYLICYILQHVGLKLPRDFSTSDIEGGGDGMPIATEIPLSTKRTCAYLAYLAETKIKQQQLEDLQ